MIRIIHRVNEGLISMNFALPILLLFASGVCPEHKADQSNVEETSGSEQLAFFSGYVRHFKRSYFTADNGDYFAVVYEDQEFNRQVSDILNQHDLKFETVCFHVEFLGLVGGDAGDLVNQTIEIRKGISIEEIDCPTQ